VFLYLLIFSAHNEHGEIKNDEVNNSINNLRNEKINNPEFNGAQL
jgi:hypothetical protein